MKQGGQIREIEFAAIIGKRFAQRVLDSLGAFPGVVFAFTLFGIVLIQSMDGGIYGECLGLFPKHHKRLVFALEKEAAERAKYAEAKFLASFTGGHGITVGRTIDGPQEIPGFR